MAELETGLPSGFAVTMLRRVLRAVPPLVPGWPSSAPRSAVAGLMVLGMLVAGCEGDATATRNVASTNPVQVVASSAADNSAANEAASDSVTPTEAHEKVSGEPTQAPPVWGSLPHYDGKLPSLAAINIFDARIETVLDGLQRPWAFEFIADDEVLITEIGGRLLRYRLGDRGPTVVANAPSVVSREEQMGLLDVALHPDFADNGWVYLSYVVEDPNAPGYFATALGRGVLTGNGLEQFEELLVAGPYGWSPSNFGGAIVFVDRSHLLVSIGDRSEGDLAQRKDRLQGKILRLMDDGTVPSDNPFVDDPEADGRVFARGVRNPQGLIHDPVSGRVFEAEHGPLGGDEVNLIEAGANYGWPVITYGRNYTKATIGEGSHREGMRQPLFYYLPSEAISPLAMYRGAMFPEWEGDLLLGALRGKLVSRLDIDGDVVRSEYPILTELDSRIRDIKVGPDGSVFILTEPGQLHRLYRETGSEVVPDQADPAVIYSLVCAGCHDRGAYKAPHPDNAAEWVAVFAQPLEDTYRNVFKGKGAMPERGLCHLCNDEHLKQTIDYVLERADQGRQAE